MHIFSGKIIQTTGSWYQVLVDKKTIPARLKGKIKLEALDTTNPIAVGDDVVLEQTETKEFVITEIKKRKNYIIRQSPRNKHQRHIIAANIDMALLIVTLSQPRTSLGFIDRFIAAAESFHIPVTIVLNKIDLLQKDKDKEQLEYLQLVYQKIGYEVICSSMITQEGISRIQTILSHKTTLVAGHSGVGKSTLLNAIHPGLNLKTGAISKKWDKGMHTTTFATMFPLTENTFIIDTPGIKEFMMLQVEPEEVSGYFIDIKKYSEGCQFNNCMHLNEPNCAVKAAVEQHKIAPTRYENYLHIVENIKDINYWERK
ncbi:MAG TPA: ribosome small subunit-dependent GTPase A [Chitinophagales bacterium]|nr:ribosome small subunit-dependent GTPase A [Chitinophagales bacterium]HNM33086.1 ribosome small subunit-dependent GTPase A [Chitinophagales bacterium]